ncbi:TonB-dependent receptor [Marinobacter panjinensis]|uniref:TonB-dependent receptor n=1 Tax=Marinobacter panjinensis TaxID=2576384 RepID=A0A4U6R3U0_9GAMM|nr:TonB-dependent receptor [Marinobacter panjinensis]MCR8913195.1 TonB-dependent receptor [Marinobacter panjinensis]TKV68121.1 TonB-dependent receptor [Marinobacter panjinensis]
MEFFRASVVVFSGLAAAFAFPGAKAQQAQGTPETVIKVTSPRLVRDLYETPAAVSVVDTPDIREGQQRLQLDESLDTVPGLFFQNRYNFAQNLRLSTRGFGARAPFGIRGIRIQVDGIPYTLPDGQSQIDAVDLDSAQRIEVIRGPSSVQYGNASGGVIDITTARGDDQPAGTRLRQDVGSDDYYKTTAQANGSQGATSGIATMSWLNYNGYRDQSEVEKGLFNGRLSHKWNDGQRLTATFNALHTPKAEDPAGLTAAQVEEDRRQATPNAERLDAGQDVDQQTLGLLYEAPVSGAGELTVSTFFTRRDFTQQLPFPGPSLIAYDRQFYGISSDYQQGSAVAGLPLTWVVGADLHRQVDERRRYSVSFNGDVTAQTQEETQNGTTAAVFAQGDLAVTERFNLSLGTRFDRLRLSVDDNRLVDGDDSGSRTYDEFSGFAGASYRVAPRQQLYATIGTAFEAPTFTEFANPDGSGGFNPDIEPQQAVNREIGIRGGFGEGLSYDLALFSIRVDDEILPFEINNRTFYENAGRTERNGVELGVGWDISYTWRITSALTLADYTLRDFEDEQGNNADGNRLPGLPREQWVTEVEWRGDGRRFAALEWQYVGDLYAENSNQTKVSDYWLFGIRAGDTVRFGRQSLNLYGGIRNLLDEDYFSNIRINANADRPVEDRGYYEPAPGRTFYAGVEWVF